MYLQEKRQEEEEAKAQLDMQLTQEAVHANKAKELSCEVCHTIQYAFKLHKTNLLFESRFVKIL